MPQPFQYSSLFGDLTKVVQQRFDAVSKLHKQLFDNIIFEKYLDWDAPTIGFDFNEIIGKYNVTIAAATIGENSNEPILPTEGLETLKDKVLRHAITRSITGQEMRRILAIQGQSMLPEKEKTNQLIDLMWGNVKSPVESVLAKIDMIFLGALFNEGRFELNEQTNPEGGVRGSISFNQPTENILSAASAWTDENVKTVDVFEDIQKVIDASQDKVAFEKILCAPSLVSYICRSAKMKQIIWGSDKSTRPVQLRDVNDFMQSNGLPIFETLRRNIRIQNNGTVTNYNAIHQSNMVFVPSGKLGVVKNAYADSELDPESDVAYSNYGRVRVAQWKVGEKQNSNRVEYVKAEVHAVPVITEMNGIYTLKTNRG